MNTPVLAHIERAARIKVMIFDVDGVLTDGSLTYGPDGEVTKTFNVLDGLGIQMLNKSGVQTAIISARLSPIVVRRARSHLQRERINLHGDPGIRDSRAPRSSTARRRRT